MTLLNGILALGAFAFTVPLAIHLLFRSRFRTIPWGAMHLLDGVVRINRRRIQLLHLLLLLLRCLVPVLLAFCLARPVLTGFQSLPGDAPQTLVIAIDDSRSMSARDETGLSRMDRAKQGLNQWLGKLSRRDEVIVVRSSQVGAPASAQGPQEAVRRIRQIDANQGPVDLGTLIRGAIEAADGGSHPQRHILLVSDFSSHLLADAAMASLSRVTASLDEKPIRPAFSFWNLAGDSSKLSNVSVEAVEIDSPAVVAGRDASFSARIRNAGDLPVRDLRVDWSINNQDLSSSTVSIDPRSSATVRLRHRMEQLGVHQLTVAVEHADALIGDNRRSVGVDVIREIRVLLVDGQPSRQPLEGETDYLAIALSPFAFGGEDQPDAVRTRVVRASQFEREFQDQVPDIIAVANVDALQGGAREILSQFVLDGGALVVFDGDNLKVDSYNEPWSCDAGSWSLPATLGSIVGVSPPIEDRPRPGSSSGQARSQDGSQQASPLVIAGRNPLYSPWDVLGDADDQTFADVEVLRYRQLALRSSEGRNNVRAGESGIGSAELGEPADVGGRMVAGPDDEAAAMVLGSMASGEPLALSAKRGRGRVVQFAIPCDTAWTTLPLRMVYLPMMQQLVLDLAGSRKQTTINIGDGFSVPIVELSPSLPEGASTDDNRLASYFLEVPGETEIEVRPTKESSPVLMIPRTDTPGPHLLRSSTPIIDGPPVITRTLRIVEVPAIESQLRDTDEARLAMAAKTVQANLATDVESLQSLDQTNRYGREIWRWLLAALLIVLVAELLLQQRSTTSAKPSLRLGET